MRAMPRIFITSVFLAVLSPAVAETDAENHGNWVCADGTGNGWNCRWTGPGEPPPPRTRTHAVIGGVDRDPSMWDKAKGWVGLDDDGKEQPAQVAADSASAAVADVEPVDPEEAAAVAEAESAVKAAEEAEDASEPGLMDGMKSLFGMEGGDAGTDGDLAPPPASLETPSEGTVTDAPANDSSDMGAAAQTPAAVEVTDTAAGDEPEGVMDTVKGWFGMGEAESSVSE